MAETNPKDAKTVIYYLLGAIVVLGILGYFATGKLPFSTNTPTRQEGALKTVDIKVGEETVNVFVSDTDSARQTGLARHETLEFGQGMLFIFPEENITPAFWMKNVNFPIDIVWINDGAVTQIDTVQPEPDVSDENLTLYSPGGPIDYVLEVPANFMFEKGLGVGDPIDLSNL